jgi:hypothetical protein
MQLLFQILYLLFVKWPRVRFSKYWPQYLLPRSQWLWTSSNFFSRIIKYTVSLKPEFRASEYLSHASLSLRGIFKRQTFSKALDINNSKYSEKTFIPRLCIKQDKINIGTCRLVRVTKITGSGSDDWNYCHLGYKFSWTHLNTALSLIYTISSSPLHTH